MVIWVERYEHILEVLVVRFGGGLKMRVREKWLVVVVTPKLLAHTVG